MHEQYAKCESLFRDYSAPVILGRSHLDDTPQFAAYAQLYWEIL